jgi:hypothetical protein
MMSRDWLFIVARLGGVSKGISGTLRREWWGEYCGYFEISMW